MALMDQEKMECVVRWLNHFQFFERCNDIYDEETWNKIYMYQFGSMPCLHCPYCNKCQIVVNELSEDIKEVKFPFMENWKVMEKFVGAHKVIDKNDPLYIEPINASAGTIPWL